MIHYVYQTTNLINGKIYVGLHKKSNRSVDYYLGSGRLIKSAISKYGRENFDFKILHICNNRSEAEIKEAEIVNEEFVLREDTYNLVVGGIGGTGKTISEEHKNAIRNSKLGISRTQEVKDKVSKTRLLRKIPSPNKGKAFSESHKKL